MEYCRFFWLTDRSFAGPRARFRCRQITVARRVVDGQDGMGEATCGDGEGPELAQPCVCASCAKNSQAGEINPGGRRGECTDALKHHRAKRVSPERCFGSSVAAASVGADNAGSGSVGSGKSEDHLTRPVTESGTVAYLQCAVLADCRGGGL